MVDVNFLGFRVGGEGCGGGGQVLNLVVDGWIDERPSRRSVFNPTLYLDTISKCRQ